MAQDRKAYLKKYQSEYRMKNRELLNAKQREYYKNSNGEVRKKNVIKNKKYRHRVRIEALAHYGNKCACCGETHKEFLCFDHINNDGSSHRKQMADRSIAPWLRRNKYPKGFQILCHNCNISKGVYGKCPHTK